MIMLLAIQVNVAACNSSVAFKHVTPTWRFRCQPELAQSFLIILSPNFQHPQRVHSVEFLPQVFYFNFEMQDYQISISSPITLQPHSETLCKVLSLLHVCISKHVMGILYYTSLKMHILFQMCKNRDNSASAARYDHRQEEQVH